MDEHGEHLVPDLRHYYGIDLRELFSEEDPLSPRFVMAHVLNLPQGSAFVASMRGGQLYRGWDEGRYMLAAQIDAIKVLQHILILANTDPKKSKPKPPQPYPLPDTRVRKPKKDEPGSFAAIAKGLIAKKRKAQS